VDSITSNLPAIALIIAGLGLTTLLVMQAVQISQLRQRVDMLTRGVNGESLEGVLDAHLELVHQVSEDLDELGSRTAGLEQASLHHYSKVGLVRFNPFPDTGGNQSFALAMLDESDDGFIVSSLHSRTGTRVYAKAIAAGRADNTLSTEEDEAIAMARSRKAAPRQAAPRPAPRPAPAPARQAAVIEPEPVAAPVVVPVRAPAVYAPPAVEPQPEPVAVEPEPVAAQAPVAAPRYVPEPEPEPEPEYYAADEPVAPAPRKGGFRGLLNALKPGGVAPEMDEEPADLPEIAEPPVRAAAPAAPVAADRKGGAAGQSKGSAINSDEDFDPDLTGRPSRPSGR
jgi:hypothetical protein